MGVIIDGMGAAGAHSSYVHSLMQQYREGKRIYDPGFALTRDYEIYEKLRRDPVIQDAVDGRKHDIAAREWTIEAASDDPLDIELASVIEKLIRQNLRRFPAARRNLAEAFMRGSTWGYPEWSVRILAPGADKVARQWCVPIGIKDMNRMRVIGEGVKLPDGRVGQRLMIWSLEKSDFIPMEHPEWYIKHIYDDVEESLGFGRGLIDSLYFVWWAKAIIWEEFLGGVERWARGRIIAKIDGTIPANLTKNNVTLTQTFLDELEKTLSRHFIAFDKKHDVQVLPGPGEGHQMCKSALDLCDRWITNLIRGSSMPEEGGSYALGKTKKDIRDDKTAADRELLDETLTDDLVAPTIRYNRAILLQAGLGGAAMPRFKTTEEKLSDPKTEADVASALVNMGFKPKREEIGRKCGYTVSKPGDDVIEAPKQPDPFGMGGGFPGSRPPFGGSADDDEQDTEPGKESVPAGGGAASRKAPSRRKR